MHHFSYSFLVQQKIRNVVENKISLFRGSDCHCVTWFWPLQVWLPSQTLESFFLPVVDQVAVFSDIFVMLTRHQCLRPYFSAVFFTRSFIQKWQVVQNVAVCLLSISHRKEIAFFFFFVCFVQLHQCFLYFFQAEFKALILVTKQ